MMMDLFGREKVERVGDSLIIRKKDKIVIWGKVFSDNGVLHWDKNESRLRYVSGDRTESVILKNFGGLSSILGSGVDPKKRTLTMTPTMVFVFVILPILGMAGLSHVNKNRMMNQAFMKGQFPQQQKYPVPAIRKPISVPTTVSPMPEPPVVSLDKNWMK